ncbi:hypothetical protein [Roseisolibacter sp. H3M3-2]|uniref:hypothetical protein n=1 Tax=Roseisolibacter sp. H3M3-2 TaxID=3031323 RepID=UPI0023DBEBE7|nr:hypothetical protein [Roseisolibacter sp. H3M3-2]MDF1503919.1 hypothetical protein [Roseisolibacter sp. H3M3-2]
MTEPTADAAPPPSVRPAAAYVALGIALVAAVAGGIFVVRAARHMPPVPPAGQAPPARRAPAPTPPGQPEYPRLK